MIRSDDIRLDPQPAPGATARRDTWQALGLLASPRPGRRPAPRRVERAVTAAEPAEA